MSCDVELVQMSPDGQIRIPNRFLYRGEPLRGEYVLPRLKEPAVYLIPARAWSRISEDLMAGARNRTEARRAARLTAPRARVLIDRYGRFSLPLSLCKRAGLGRSVTLELIGGSLMVKPEAEFNDTLEFIREANADDEIRLSRSGDTTGAVRARSSLMGSPRINQKLAVPADRIVYLTAEALEAFVRECLWQMGFRCHQVGRAGQADGGVDLIVCSAPSHPFPHLLAVQVKSRAGGIKATPVSVVREFLGALESLPVSGGILVCNSRFTRDARRLAEQHKNRIWLRDIEDLQRWKRGEFRARQFTSEVNSALHLGQGVTFSVEGGRIRRRWELR